MATQETTQRPLFFEGQYLSAEDLGAIVEYFRTQAARHALGAHTWGIAVGLELEEKPTSDKDIVDVVIKPGYAWDGFGRPIVVPTPSQLSVEKFTSIQFGKDSSSDALLDGVVKVWLCYDEKQTRDVREGFEVCDPANPLARAVETFKVEVGEQQPTHDPIITAGYELEKAIKDFGFSTLTSTPNSQLNPDDSVPYQMFSEISSTARWLIPLGLVGWQPSSDSNKPSHFKPLTKIKNNPSNRNFLQESEAMRRSTGWVLSAIVVEQNTIELRNRHGKKLTVLIRKGDLDVEGNVSLLNDGKLYFGEEKNLYLQRNNITGLQAIIGNTDKFEIGPADDAAIKFFVQGDGVFGTDKTPATLRLGESEIKDTQEGELSIQRSGKSVVAFNGNYVGIGTGDADRLLTIQSNDSTDGTYFNVKNIKVAGNSPPVPNELVLGSNSGGGIVKTNGIYDLTIQSGKDLQLQAGGDKTKLVITESGTVEITKANQVLTSQPINILTIDKDTISQANVTNLQAGGDLRFKTGNSSGSMILTAGGNVGIGMDPPVDEKLSVAGELHCQSLTVDGAFSPGSDLTITGKVTAGGLEIGANTKSMKMVFPGTGKIAITEKTSTDNTLILDIKGDFGSTADTPTLHLGKSKISYILEGTNNEKLTLKSGSTDGNGIVAFDDAKVVIGTNDTMNSDRLEIKGKLQGKVANFNSLEVTGLPKAFRIKDSNNRLFGCSLRESSGSGVEAEVCYRGNDKLATGKKEVNLPNHFHDITETPITIQLTPIHSGISNAKISALAATAVENGKFSVHAIDTNNPNQEFYWEVKAVLK